MPGGRINHDAYGIVFGPSLCFWVIDGATALKPEGEDELKRFVEAVNQEIGKEIDHTDEPLIEIMAKVAESVSGEFDGFPHRELWERPSCTVALARLQNNQLEYFVLSDAVIVVNTSGGIRTFSNIGKLADLDKRAIEAKTRLQREKGITSREARAAIQPILLRHRAMMNAPEGYWVFNGDPEACYHATFGKLDLSAGAQVLVATDGFGRLVDVTNVFPDWKTAFAVLTNSSLKQIFQLLREAEDNDPECLEYPRFWIHDDATAVYVEI